MQKKFFISLVEKYLSGSATANEKAVIDEYLAKLENTGADSREDSSAVGQRIWSRIKTQTSHNVPVKHISFEKWLKYAAAILIIIGGATYLLVKQKSSLATELAVNKSPGTNKASLTLADGRVIELDSTVSGNIAQQGIVSIHSENGKLLYDPSEKTGEINPQYNTMTTPRGGQYQLTLSDGSKVWLNAATSLKFPAFFTGNERVVELDGEAYFEIAANKSMPFKVKAGKTNIDVLGTNFNINCYKDEMVENTTLLQGSVRLNTSSDNIILKPGQQGAIDISAPAKIKIREVDAEEIIAWKNGLFHFNKADIKTIVRQLERWYDIKTMIKGDVGKKTVSGFMPRDAKLSQVLKMLEFTAGITYTIDNDVLLITAEK